MLMSAHACDVSLVERIENLVIFSFVKGLILTHFP